MDRNYDVKILGEETLYHGKRVTLKKLYIKIDDKKTFREIVDFGEAVAILPILNERPVIEQTEIIVIKQYRPAVGRWIIEIPAGVVERGEKLEETAIRELIEETGYIPNKLERLASIHPTPGYSNETIHIFIARDLQPGKPRLEPCEAIRIEKTTIRQALKLLLENQPADAKTLTAILLYLHFKAKT